MNTKYGKMNGSGVEYAPDVLTVSGAVKVNPSEASYLAAGWKRIVDAPPEPEEGKDVVFSAWEETETELRRVYKQVEHVEEPAPEPETDHTAEPGRRVFSKLKLVTALKEANKWVLVKTWLEEKSYYDYYLAAQDFAEDYPLFQEGLAALKEYARLADEEIEAILARCVAG